MNESEVKRKLRDLSLDLQDIIDDLSSDAGEFPIPEEQLVFKNGNLWKPHSDSDGSLVILLREDWPEPDKVVVPLKNGLNDVLRYTGRSNGNRHTYRGIEPGEKYLGHKGGGGAYVYYGEEARLIPIPGAPKERHPKTSTMTAALDEMIYSSRGSGQEILEIRLGLDDYSKAFAEIEAAMKATKWRYPIRSERADRRDCVLYNGVQVVLWDV